MAALLNNEFMVFSFRRRHNDLQEILFLQGERLGAARAGFRIMPWPGSVGFCDSG
jgi:hypothetical protein